MDISLNLSDETLSLTHDKIVTVEEGFMFHDLYGNPMMIKNIEVIRWIPKWEK